MVKGFHFSEAHPDINASEVENMLASVLQAYDNGTFPGTNKAKSEKWDIYNCIFLAGTIVTTIGIVFAID